jgi:hypothetical protein
LIATTKTATGLEVEARLDTRGYPTKVRVTEEQMGRVRLHPHEFRGEWNYSIEPIATRLPDKLIVLTTDRDFEALSDLAIENWVV